MATIRGIKKRVKSVKNIAQITRAMQMVAASKMKKAQQKADIFKYYANKISRAAEELSQGVDPTLHRLLQEGNPDGAKLVIIVTTNKGLCGSLNNNLLRKVKIWIKDIKKRSFAAVGKKGVDFIRGSGATLIADYSQEEYSDIVSALTRFAIDGFVAGEFRQVEIVFNRFVNSFTQVPNRLRLLPITLDDSEQEQTDKAIETQNNIDLKNIAFKVEPSETKVLDFLLPEYVENKIRDALYTAEASEHSARMVAMKNATENADSIVADLTLEYNKLRQQDITMSIADMVTARLAVKQ